MRRRLTVLVMAFGMLGPIEASAASSGGASAPATESGGTQYGQIVDPSSAPPARIVVSTFALSATTLQAGGDPARVTFRVDGGARRVRVFLRLTRTGEAAPAYTAHFGVRRARRVYTRRVRVPADRLSPGTYVATLRAVDAVPGRRLRAAAATSLSTVEAEARPVTVVAAPKPEPVSTPVPPAPAPAPAPVSAPVPVAPASQPATTAAPPSPLAALSAVSGTFPVRGTWTFGGEDARFGAARGTRAHRGQDVVAAEGTSLVSPRAGTVTWTAFQAGGAGNYVVIRDGLGRDYVFMHLRELSPLGKGAAVAQGATIGSVGNTGSSSGPHLHFEIWPQGWFSSPSSAPVDPLEQLQAWAAG